MIRNFTDRDTEQLFRTERNRRFNGTARVTLRRLIQMKKANHESGPSPFHLLLNSARKGA